MRKIHKGFWHQNGAGDFMSKAIFRQFIQHFSLPFGGNIIFPDWFVQRTEKIIPVDGNNERRLYFLYGLLKETFLFRIGRAGDSGNAKEEDIGMDII